MQQVSQILEEAASKPRLGWSHNQTPESMAKRLHLPVGAWGMMRKAQLMDLMNPASWGSPARPQAITDRLLALMGTMTTKSMAKALVIVKRQQRKTRSKSQRSQRNYNST